MADVAAPASLDNPARPPQGTKRAADGSLEHEQRLSKRFDLLNLETGSHVCIGVPSAASSTFKTQAAPSSACQSRLQTRPRPRPRPANDDGMLVEDTPHRIYIHDLGAELGEIESDEDSPIFLSDIEKHLSKLPRQLLQGAESAATKDKQLVLYSVPTSLTVPHEQDNVRKAIVEARQRIRDKQAGFVLEPKRESWIVEPSVLSAARTPAHQNEDEDAMDID